MRPLKLSLICLLVIHFLAPTVVWAAPPLPLSLYGRLDPNHQTIDPTTQTVEAKIQDQVFSRARILAWETGWVYTLDVLGDDPATPEKDGGVSGETVTLWVGSLLATPTTTWQSGVSRELPLTLPAALTPTPTPPVPLIGDIDQDHDVDIFDFNLMLTYFGQTGPSSADLDGDNDVDIFDYSILLQNFGQTN